MKKVILAIIIASSNIALAESSYVLTDDNVSKLPVEIIHAVEKELGGSGRYEWKIPNFTIRDSVPDFDCNAKRIIKADFDGDMLDDYAFWVTFKKDKGKFNHLYLYESSTEKLIFLEDYNGDDIYVPDLEIVTEKLPLTADYDRYKDIIPVITDFPRLSVTPDCGSQSTEWVKDKKGEYTGIDRGC